MFLGKMVGLMLKLKMVDYLTNGYENTKWFCQ